MNAKELKASLYNQLLDKAKARAKYKAEVLSSLIAYETAIANTELAMTSNMHGFDFKFIPDSFFKNIIFSCVTDDGLQARVTLIIPAAALKDVSDRQVDFFKEYILPNAEKRLSLML